MTTKIEQTLLYTSFSRRVTAMTAAPSNLLTVFDQLRHRLEAEGKYIVVVFPEYTPHDWVDHISNLFSLADRLLGPELYERLNPAELTLLTFGLASHDWGMAVSDAELSALKGDPGRGSTFALLPGEPTVASRRVATSETPQDVAWREYLRETSGRRSGARLREFLAPVSSVFSEAVAKIAEGHTLNAEEIRDQSRYPTSMSVFGEVVNLAAISTYVRIVDLLDIGEDRTPYALWKFVAPQDQISQMHWDRHRALAPVSVKGGGASRRVTITGSTSDPETYAALADLQSWVDSQFDQSINTLRTSHERYDIDLDSQIDWIIHSVGFEALTLRFELERNQILQLLSSELYDRDPLVFARELLQNSVDAIDAREAILRNEGATLRGEIDIHITSDADDLKVEWRDNGIGMDEKVLRSFFCKIGHSWYQSREARAISGLDAISRFGVGILSCFTVSNQIEIETRRDPNMSHTRDGLLVQIPSRSSHFRVWKAPGVPVGTCVRMRISRENLRFASKEALCKAIIRISRFVRHQIRIHLDGVTINAGSSTSTSTGAISASEFVNSIRGDAAQVIATNTSAIEVVIGSSSDDYVGVYRALFPTNPLEVESTTDYSVWTLSEKTVELDDIVTLSEEAIFLKGVQAGPVFQTPRGHSRDGSMLNHIDWIKPTLLLNLARPSLAETDLSRSSVRPKNEKLLLDLHSEIAKKVANTIYGGLSQDPGRNALLLGALARFGGISMEALSSLLPPDDIPVLVLGSNSGFHWRTLGEYTSRSEFLEAPFELQYAWGNQYGSQSIELSRNFRWGGRDVLITSMSSRKHPWLSSALSIARETLRGLGWHPTAIRTATPPSNELIPLVCREWTPIQRTQVGQAPSDASTDEAVWRDAAPELVLFPSEIAAHAAFGSRYWNSSHKKIRAISATLIELRRQFENGALSNEFRAKYEYLTSNKYYDFVVPSRMSGTTLALSLPNNLLDLASDIGLTIEYRLEAGDFHPGSIGRYSNPYLYSLSSWMKSEVVFGEPWVPS